MRPVLTQGPAAGGPGAGGGITEWRRPPTGGTGLGDRI